MDDLSRPSRTVIAVIVLGMLALSGLPFSLMGVEGPAETASAESGDVSRDFVVGTYNMVVDTLNPNVYTTSHEMMTIFPCYSTLLQYDEDSHVIGDLARSWDRSADGLTWHFELTSNAYFCDPADPATIGPQVTSDDVVFTFTAIQDNPASRLYPFVPGVISSIWSEGAFEVYIELGAPFAPFMDALVGVPILPEYIWGSEDLLNFDNMPPVGSGPFYYSNVGLPDDGVVVLERNPHWHMTADRGWSMRVDRWILKDEPNVAVGALELQLGEVDCMLDVPASYFLYELPNHPDLIGFSQSGGFVYEFNLNQMSDELRADLGGAYRSGANSQLLLDEVVKEAIAMCVDKQRFVDEVLYDLGSVADSLVPDASPWHYDYPDPVLFDPQGARQMLMDAGWAFDKYGGPAADDTVPLCREDGQDMLSFRFFTLDTMPEWSIGAQMITGWCAEAGIELDVDIKSVQDMNSAWYSADYDLWLWDWVFDPMADPSSECLVLLTTDAIGTSSDVFCSIPEYDDLYLQSVSEMDALARGAIIDEMQAIAYEDMGCQCVAYRDDLYGVSTMTWTNYGGLESKYMMRPDVSSLWLSLNMYPQDNAAPLIYGLPSQIEGAKGEPIVFVAAAVDDDPTTELEYRWFWGDGTATAWSTSPYATHTYAEDGVYTADLAVREATSSNGFADFFVTSGKVEVVVIDYSNLAPTDLSISYVPLSPDTASTVLFTGSASDPEGDLLWFSWDFGDGGTALGSSVEHEYASEGLYVVTMYVTDGHLGVEERPVSISTLILISENSPPMIFVPDFSSVLIGTPAEYVVSASDPDAGDTLEFTWDWGDGSVSVTYVPYATHTYVSKGTYTVTVTVSDMTGLPGHEVSDSGIVYVYSGAKKHHSGG